MPNPLEPGHIPRQNPATPERMPGHTRTPAGGHWRHASPWLVVVTLVGIAMLYALGVIGH
jgi:hypothetical protein